MKNRIFMLSLFLLVIVGFVIAQDNEAERKQKEAAAKAEAEKQAAIEAEKQKKEIELAKKEIQILLDEYCKALNGDDIDKLLACYYFKDDKLKEDFKKELQSEISKREITYSEFVVKTVQIGTEYTVVQYTYKYKRNYRENEEWKEKSESEFCVNVEGVWKIDPSLSIMWSEGKTALWYMKAALDTYNAKTGGDLSCLITFEFTCISKYYKELRIDPDAFKNLQYFDEEDFVVKLNSSDRNETDTYIIKCKASLGKGRGNTKKGPEFGEISFNSETMEWKEDYFVDFKITEKKEEKENEPEVKPKSDDEE